MYPCKTNSFQIFSKKAIGFQMHAKQKELFHKNLSSEWSNQAGKIVLTASQFAQCLALSKDIIKQTAKDYKSTITGSHTSYCTWYNIK